MTISKRIITTMIVAALILLIVLIVLIYDPHGPGVSGWGIVADGFTGAAPQAAIDSVPSDGGTVRVPRTYAFGATGVILTEELI